LAEKEAEVLTLREQLSTFEATTVRERELEEEVISLKARLRAIEQEKSYDVALEKVSNLSLNEKKVGNPIPSHLIGASNRGWDLVDQNELQENVWRISQTFIMQCSHWEEDHQVIILDESVIFSFVEGTATLGWPKKEVYINFYETEGDGDGEAEEITKFEACLQINRIH
jgi:hypothetical protein